MGIKRLLILLMALLLFVAPCCAAAQEDDENLLRNGGFEELNENGKPVGWYTDAYIRQEGYTVFSVQEDARTGKHCAVVNNLGMNDARYAQTVRVEPLTMYCLSGWIRAEEIPDSGLGANLSIEGVYVFSESVFDTEGEWVYVEMYGETDEDQKEIIVFARVGGYSGESVGMAAFDDLSLRKVDQLPDDVIASLWYQPQSYVIDDDTYEEEESTEAAPFWPWLLVISAVFAAACWVTAPYLMKEEPLSERQQHGMPVFVMVGLIVAFAVRFVTALLVEGYQVDVNCFLSWGGTMAKVGPGQFYQSTGFCDYPPAYVYVLGLNSLLAGELDGVLRASVVFKLIPMLCDIAAAWILYHFVLEHGMERRQAGVMCLLLAYNPAILLTSAAWCQVDIVLAVGLMLVAWLAMRRKWKWLLPVYVLFILVKPQALMLGFLGLLALVFEWRQHRESRKDMLIGVGISAAVAAVILVPFSLHQPLDWLIKLYGNTLASYPYATVNTANFYYLFNANWVGIAQPANAFAPLLLGAATAGWAAWLFVCRRKQAMYWLEPAVLSAFALTFIVLAFAGAAWSLVGAVAMAMVMATVLMMYWRGDSLKYLPLCGAVLFILLYVVGIKMHERYLFPALALLAMAFAIHRDRRILLLLAVMSCTMFVNSGIVLDNSIRLGSSMGHLNADTRWLNMLLSFVNVLCAGLAAWVCHRVCVDRAEAVKIGSLKTLFKKAPGKSARNIFTYRVDHRLHWKRIDWVLMLSVTLVYAVVALWNLGSTTAPQNPWKSTAANEMVVIDLGDEYEEFTMLYYAQVSYSDFSVAVSSDGESWSHEYWAQMDQGQCFRWMYLVPCYETPGGSRSYSSATTLDGVQKLSGRYVRIMPQQISLVLNEVIFRDSTGKAIPAVIHQVKNANIESPNYSDAAALLDEQDTLQGEPGWYNSTYFDEIYHARTAYEHLHGMTPYETTHPPLGKLLMSICVAIFGMTPFGWRLAGALAGIAMLPGMYLLGKQLTKRTDMALTAMLLMALDCMHLTQTRIATIDSFPVLFIIFSYLFMLRFMHRDVVLTPVRKLLPDLALSGLFMGLSVASKWIGAYAGIGLAILFFWTCVRHIRMRQEASAALENHEKIGSEMSEELHIRESKTMRQLLTICCWCLLFFVAVPVCIYLISYIPYFAYAEIDGIGDFIARVIRAQENMLNYHGTPGLGMDHPFYSPWYEWPLIKRPMYYAMARFMPEGISLAIFCFGNPAVWLTGLAGIAAVAFVWAKRHCYLSADSDLPVHLDATSWSVAPAFILISLLAQFLPWVLVPRGTYIYHYFASVPFLILATTLLLHWIRTRYRKTASVIMIVYFVVCLAFFIGFYPYASGMPVPVEWLNFMKQFLHVYH